MRTRLFHNLRLATLLVAGITPGAVPASSSAQPGDGDGTGRSEAAALLQAALAAHGSGFDRLRVEVRYSVELRNEAQSLAVEAPFESYRGKLEVVHDAENDTSAVFSRTRLPGGFVFSNVLGPVGDKHYEIDLVTGTYTELPDQSIAAALTSRVLPHRHLQAALRDATGLALQREPASSGRPSVLATFADRPAMRLTFDARTSRLAGIWVSRPASASPYGDGAREVRYTYDDDIGPLGVLVPETITLVSETAVHGAVEQAYRLVEIEDSVGPPDVASALKQTTPASYAWRPGFGTEEIAPGVHVVHNVTGTGDQWSYNVLVVEFEDHVLVAEAPVGERVSEAVLGEIRRIAPGKPVKYLVQSHHHGDHLQGIRTYIAEGATIVTTGEVAPVIRRIAAAHPRSAPDRLSRAPRAPAFALVQGARTFRDGANEAVVYDIGPNPHAREMLVVYLPRHGILYQADMINAHEYPANQATFAFLHWLDDSDLKVSQVVGAHGKRLDAAAFADYVRHAVEGIRTGAE